MIESDHGPKTKSHSHRQRIRQQPESQSKTRLEAKILETTLPSKFLNF